MATKKKAPKKSAGKIDPWQALEQMHAHALVAMTEMPDVDTRKAMWAAADTLKRIAGDALRGHAGAAEALQRLARAGEATESRYLLTEQLCERWMAGEQVNEAPMWRHNMERDRVGELAWALRNRVDPAFSALWGELPRQRVMRAQKTAQSARQFAARLIMLANAIEPRRKGESAETYEKRVKQALADAKSRSR